MDKEKKYGYAKKAAIATAGGAIAAGASAWSDKGNEPAIAGLQSGTEDLADEMEVYSGDYEIVEEDSLTEEPLQETGTPEVSQPERVSLEDLPFGEAFRAARQMCGGGGGVFEWHGNFYNTYTREEFEQLTDADMDNLYSIYKQITNGDTQQLISSLEHTITTENYQQTTDTLGQTAPDDYSDSEHGYDNSPDTDSESDNNDADSYDDDFNGGDTSFPSDTDSDDIDFNNLYS